MEPKRNSKNDAADRRKFFKQTLAAGLGVAGLAVPAGAALAALLDPLSRRARAAEFVRVTTLDALPENGRPRRFRVFAEHQDGWLRFTQQAVGAVYLRRTGENTVEAFNVVCPHAGCHVIYQNEEEGFHCPCHNSWFGLVGTVREARSPSPRALDSLQTEIRPDKEVWVKFQNFRTGTSEKIPLT